MKTSVMDNKPPTNKNLCKYGPCFWLTRRVGNNSVEVGVHCLSLAREIKVNLTPRRANAAMYNDANVKHAS